MYRLLKKISYHFNCLQTSCIWFLKMVIHGNFLIKKPAKRLNRRAIILGNGPSLKNVIHNIKPYNEDIIAVNEFCHNPEFLRLKPKIYILLDTAYYKLSKNEEECANTQKTLAFLKKATWHIRLVVPSYFFKTANRMFDGTKIEPVPLIQTYYKGWKLFEIYLFKRGWSMPTCQNVLIGAVGYALQAQYKEIHIYGADHSWFSDIAVDDNSRLCLVENHFYDDTEQKLKPWVLMDGSVFKVSDFCLCMYHTFSSYDKLQKYANVMKISIINKTNNSFIDSFKKG